MVQANLEGRKSQTRREVKEIPEKQPVQITEASNEFFKLHLNKWIWAEESGLIHFKECPFGKVGDVLWVREMHYAFGHWQKDGVTKTGKQKWSFVDLTGDLFTHYHYCNNPPSADKIKFERIPFVSGYYKRNSLFMPKAACRMFHLVKGVRVERLQDISERDAIDEGIEPHWANGPQWVWYPKKDNSFINSAVESYKSLWISINGKESWDANPWVWVIEYEAIDKPEGWPNV